MKAPLMQPLASAGIVVAANANANTSPANSAFMSIGSVRLANPRRAISFRRQCGTSGRQIKTRRIVEIRRAGQRVLEG
jgi:hypothetical protein